MYNNSYFGFIFKGWLLKMRDFIRLNIVGDQIGIYSQNQYLFKKNKSSLIVKVWAK